MNVYTDAITQMQTSKMLIYLRIKKLLSYFYLTWSLLAPCCLLLIQPDVQQRHCSVGLLLVDWTCSELLSLTNLVALPPVSLSASPDWYASLAPVVMALTTGEILGDYCWDQICRFTHSTSYLPDNASIIDEFVRYSSNFVSYSQQWWNETHLPLSKTYILRE